MKILILANNDVGLYKFRKELIEKLLENNEVYISLPNGEFVDALKQIGCVFLDTPIDRRGINPFTDLKLLLFYNRMLKQINPDIVITYTIKPNTYGGLICRKNKIPYVINVTGLGTAFQSRGILRRFVSFLYKISCKKAKTIFFENIGNQQLFIKEKIAKKDNTCLLNGAGVNLEKFSYIDYPEDNSTTKFLFVGRIMKEKGIDELLLASKRLHIEGYKFSLDILGFFEEDYKEQFEAGTLEGWLQYHGYNNDVRPFIKNCHCFVLPSWHEGMANTNLECAASGRPIITSDIHGCKEAVIEGESGYLCEKQNADSLYEAMKKFLELDLESRRNMGIKSRKLMEDVFDKQKVVEETIKNL